MGNLQLCTRIRNSRFFNKFYELLLSFSFIFITNKLLKIKYISILAFGSYMTFFYILLLANRLYMSFNIIFRVNYFFAMIYNGT